VLLNGCNTLLTAGAATSGGLPPALQHMFGCNCDCDCDCETASATRLMSQLLCCSSEPCSRELLPVWVRRLGSHLLGGEPAAATHTGSLHPHLRRSRGRCVQVQPSSAHIDHLPSLALLGAIGLLLCMPFDCPQGIQDLSPVPGADGDTRKASSSSPLRNAPVASLRLQMTHTKRWQP
jgi:hypothetical protein